jgi:hypothetical protein
MSEPGQSGNRFEIFLLTGRLDLFSGGIGYCKNPSGHGETDFDRTSAAQLLALASYLLSQVEAIEAAIKQARPVRL